MSTVPLSPLSTTPGLTINQAVVPAKPSLHDGLGAKMIAGGLSCCFISTIMNPMDVLKIRLQSQNQLTTQTTAPTGLSMKNSLYAGAKYTGTVQGLKLIASEEGFRGMMRGITPSLLREMSYSSIRMGMYDAVKGLIEDGKTKEQISFTTKLLAGMITGAAGSSLANPLDLMKIRFQAYDSVNRNPYRNTFDAIGSTVREQGIRGIYKGVGPTMARAAMLNGSSLSSYDHTKHLLIKHGYVDEGIYAHLCGSFVSGLVTTTAVNPFDVIKTRIMTDGQNGVKRYTSGIDCLIKTARHEGMLAFSKGWLPNYCRLGPHFFVSLPLAEFIRRSLGADSF